MYLRGGGYITEEHTKQTTYTKSLNSIRIVSGNMTLAFSINSGIFDNRSVLTNRYTPSEIVGREEELQEYVSQLTPAVNGNQPNNIFIYGNAGVGKTSCTQYVLREASRAAEQGGNSFNTFHVNCDGASTGYQAAIKIDSVIRKSYYGVGKNDRVDGIEPARNGVPTAEVFERLLQLIDTISGVCIIVLDDVEKIEPNELSDVLYQLTRSESQSVTCQTSVGTVLISSRSDYLSSLPSDIQSSFGGHTIQFPAYTVNELVNLLQERIDSAFETSNVVNDNVVMECASIAADDGDARRALELLRVAGDIAVENNNEQVSQDCLEKAKSRVLEGEIEMYINSLSEQQKVVMYALLITIEKAGTQPRTKEIYQAYTDLVSYVGMRENSYRRIQQILNDLYNNGVVNRMEYNGGRGESGGKFYTYGYLYPNNLIIDLLDNTIEMCGVHQSIESYVTN